MDCLPCERCREVDWAEYRNKNCAILAGALFTVGWWLALDASVTDHENTKDLYHLCGVFSVLSLLMVNTISNGHLQSDGGLYTDGILSGVAAKIWFFVGFLFGFGSLIGAFVIFFTDYTSAESQFSSVVPGIKFVCQNLFILLSSLVYRFGRVEDAWGY